MHLPARFQRQIQLPQIGAEGQQKLLNSTVLLVGVGGLGCTTALQLAACGVGHLILVDFDNVEESNLHRQILYRREDVGQPKAAVAARVIEAQFPDTKCTSHVAEFTASLALDLVPSADVVVDGTDRLETRYLMDDVCRMFGKPWSYASVDGFNIQWTFFNQGCSYRSLFPVPPDPFSIRTCAANGVLGAVPALAAMHQAMDVLRYLLNLGDQPVVLHHLDTLTSAHYELEIPESGLPVPTADEILRTDYTAFCNSFKTA